MSRESHLLQPAPSSADPLTRTPSTAHGLNPSDDSSIILDVQTPTSGVSTISLDLRALDYLSPVDDNLTCSVCRCAFIKPVMTRCEHVFCKDCFESATKHQSQIKCPFCRSSVDSSELRDAPRALINMVEDLRVKCPHRQDGCEEETTRSNIKYHVERYCELTEVECPDKECPLMISRRRSDQPCLHKQVACEDCDERMMEKDVENHREHSCSNRWTTCDKCSSTILHCHSPSHPSSCPEAIISCPGASIGCTHQSKRIDLPTHVTDCTLAMLAPTIAQQSNAIQTLTAENRTLKSRIASLTLPPFDEDLPYPAPLSNTSSPSSSSAAHPTTDPTTHHLLTTYDSLRADIDRLSSSLSELDARTSMMLLNESLRAKEDVAHLNAVLGAMRVQLHWLMTTRLQQDRARAGGAGGGGGGGVGTVGGAAAVAAAAGRAVEGVRGDTKL
ncbi:MAG: hypothetical protein M1833_000901 [Piccolia ochrophora]|nr:MAG: hypothetical protein M1833_000901 [Piccolia ochrophora]